MAIGMLLAIRKAAIRLDGTLAHRDYRILQTRRGTLAELTSEAMAIDTS
jgi:hypothetical protein